jgi:hypothetical protein
VNITVEQIVQATPEVRDLIGELNDVLGAAYEAESSGSCTSASRGRLTRHDSLIASSNWHGNST